MIYRLNTILTQVVFCVLRTHNRLGGDKDLWAGRRQNRQSRFGATNSYACILRLNPERRNITFTATTVTHCSISKTNHSP